MVYTNFNKKIFNGLNAKFIDNMVIIEINDKKFAKIKLIYSRVMDQYDTYEVSIINKETGLIDKESFSFYNCFTDSDKQNCCSSKEFYANPATGSGWYFAIPKPLAVKRYLNKIMDYINLFK